MQIRRQSVPWISAVVIGLAPGLAAAQARPPCPPAPQLEAKTLTVDTKTALDAVSKLLGKVGVDINFKTTRDSILKDNPRADQVVIVLTMANTFCQMIWSDTTLSGADKAARFQAMMQDMLARALGPAPVARTDATQQSRLERPGGPAMFYAGVPLLKPVAAGGGAPVAGPDGGAETALPQPQTGFLRDAPFYVTEGNKYFVIVGSAPSQEEGVRLMRKLKVKAPQHDFALYAPYGGNANFGVMMATWVPHDVALQALQLARRDVAGDAYLWACRSSGESC